MGALLGGYALGQSVSDLELSQARLNGYAEGVREIQVKTESAEYRDETFAKLLAIIRTPEVQNALPAKTNESVKLAAEALNAGDSKKAAEALSGGVISLTTPECLGIGASALVELGTAISTCHIYRTRAVIGMVDTFSDKISITVDGTTELVSPGHALTPQSMAECHVLFERLVQTETGLAARVSFDC